MIFYHIVDTVHTEHVLKMHFQNWTKLIIGGIQLFKAYLPEIPAIYSKILLFH